MLYDLVVIGGGINGCGCAADAAIRGLSVLLCEQDDIASKTSSSSSQLIHGGLRYLEHHQFRMVKNALDEQAILMHIAPHLIHALAFILPNQYHIRPSWLIRIGLFLYDHLSLKNPLANSKTLNRTDDPDYFSALNPNIQSGFLYYDCQTDDARLTLSVALLAQEQGATIVTRTRLIAAEADNHHWLLTLKPEQKEPFTIKAKAVINAAGPWVADLAHVLHVPLKQTPSFVKGSHIVVPRLYEGTHAYLLQQSDHRIIFVIPFHGDSLIGTTEMTIDKPSNNPSIHEDEIHYLIQAVQHYFHQTLEPKDIITSWSGTRLLLAKSGQSTTQLSRDYTLEWSDHPHPILTIYGGKITAYRRLAQDAIDHFRALFPHLPHSTTQDHYLPGSAWHAGSFEDYQNYAHHQYAWLDKNILTHYLKTYGTRTELILENCHQHSDLGIAFGPILYQKEVAYLIRHEWALTCDDILWRRTKLGLTMHASDQNALKSYLNHCF